MDCERLRGDGGLLLLSSLLSSLLEDAVRLFAESVRGVGVVVSRNSFTVEEVEGSIADQVGQSAGGKVDGEAGRSSGGEGRGWVLICGFGGVVTGVSSDGVGTGVSSESEGLGILIYFDG